MFTKTEVAPLLNCRCIAICSVGELFGGVERHIIGLLKGLRGHGIDTLLFLFYDHELAAQARSHGFEPIILPRYNSYFLSTARYMAQVLQQRQIRIVHVHGYKATVFSLLARYWYSFSILKTEHGLLEPMVGRPVQKMYNYLYRFLDILATRKANAIVCYVTEELQTHYRGAYHGLQSITIPNGIASIDRLSLQRPSEFREDWFNLVIVGRLETVKGHSLAIEAIAAASNLADLHLQIVGSGPCESELKILAEKLNISHKIHFLGFQRNAYNYIAYCHALLMPSLHEGLPYTLLEAMALGAPIIASQVGGLAEVLQNDITALLIPPGNSEALAQSIRRLYSDPELRCRLAKNAQQLQQTQFSLEKMIQRYLSAYQKLLN